MNKWTSAGELSIFYSQADLKEILFVIKPTRKGILVFSPGPGGTPLYKVYRYVPPQRVWFLSRFGLKTGIDFEHFGLKLGMVIGGTFTKAYKFIFLPSNQGK